MRGHAIGIALGIAASAHHIGIYANDWLDFRTMLDRHSCCKENYAYTCDPDLAFSLCDILKLRWCYED